MTGLIHRLGREAEGRLWRKICVSLIFLTVAVTVSAQEQQDSLTCSDYPEGGGGKAEGSTRTEQDNNQKQSEAKTYYLYAEAYYNNGYFDIAVEYLKKAVKNADKLLKSGAYRLMALSHIEQGRIEEADDDVRMLLETDPYFSPAFTDNATFIAMLNTHKHEEEKITTASQQAESIEETPVPVTLITEDMLHDIGARTVKDALLAYVPGMTDISCNEEMNISMHGLYSFGQEKILIMLNGHRMNSFSTNSASPDFSMSIEKVKRIEVLRGPASSIYGGVALSGVVNIITKDGGDIDGLKVKAGIGNYGQKRADLLFGKKYLSFDIMAWASMYESCGEKVHYTKEQQKYSLSPVEGDIILGGYNGSPSYDIGLSFAWDKLTMMYNQRFSKTVAPYSLNLFFSPYSYEKYQKWNGNKPGYAIQSDHAEIAYNDKKGNLAWTLTLTYDYQWQQRYYVAGDELPEMFSVFTDIYVEYKGDTIRIPARNGRFMAMNWEENTLGAMAQGAYKYSLGKKLPGVLLFGGHVSYFDLLDSSYMDGMDYNNVVKTYDDIGLKSGSEKMADAYIQVKQSLTPWLTLNAGARYDFKERNTGKTIRELSPRLAMIFDNKTFNIKLSYSKAFVDAPYYYRNNKFYLDGMSADLNPEYLQSFQLSFISNKRLVKDLSIDANIFYNIASDLITTDLYSMVIMNAGKMTTQGVEMALGYSRGRFAAHCNMTWQRLISFENYDAVNGSMKDVPKWSGNIVMAYSPFKNLRLHANLNMASEQKSLYANNATEEEVNVPARALLNAGADLSLGKMTLTLNAYNVLNKKYSLGGNTVVPIRQPGCWLLGSIAYAF